MLCGWYFGVQMYKASEMQADWNMLAVMKPWTEYKLSACVDAAPFEVKMLRGGQHN